MKSEYESSGLAGGGLRLTEALTYRVSVCTQIGQRVTHRTGRLSRAAKGRKIYGRLSCNADRSADRKRETGAKADRGINRAGRIQSQRKAPLAWRATSPLTEG